MKSFVSHCRITIFLIMVVLTPFGVSSQARQQPVEDTIFRGHEIHQWQLSSFYEHDTLALDTGIDDIQVYNPLYKSCFLPIAHLGNVAAPAQSLFFDGLSADFHNQAYRLYLTTDEDLTYFNTKEFYTNIFYISNFSKDNNFQSINLLHTQNIRPWWNASLRYNLYGSDGIYKNTKDKFSSFIFSTSYERRRYRLYFHLKNQQFKTGLNGGIVDTAYLSQDLATTVIPVRLENAHAKLRNLDIGALQLFSLTKPKDSTSLGNMFVSLDSRFENQHYWYSDQADTNFYSQLFLDSSQTNDSTYHFQFKNDIRLHFLWKQFHFFAGFRLQNETYGLTFGDTAITVLDTVTQSTKTRILYADTSMISQFVTGGIRFSTKRLYGDLIATQAIAGYYNKDNILTSHWQFLSKTHRPLASLVFEQKHQAYDLFWNRYMSNHFKWNFDTLFNAYHQTIITATLHPTSFAEAGIRWARIKNMIYFNPSDTLVPQQYHSAIYYKAAFLQGRFHVGPVYAHTHIIYQLTDNETLLPYPKIVAYQSLAYQHYLFNHVLLAQIGVQVWYFSKVNAYAYIPSLSQFYPQQTVMVGDYPYVDAYLNFSLKRARLFFMMQHINAKQMGNEYFTVKNYPMTQMAFRFGLSWNFFD